MQKIVPHLWFDKQAKEAADFYVSIFGNGSKINHYSVIKDTPSGDTEIVSFEIAGFEFNAISAGPYFKLNPSISFFVNFDPSKDDKAEENLQSLWEKLSDGGQALMELQEYPFSKLYGWIADKYGVNWQLILTNPQGEERPFIVPSLMFTQDKAGKAEEAINFYTSIFSQRESGTKIGTLARYPKGMDPDKEGTLMYSDFKLAGVWFAAMDSAQDHKFVFNEAASFIVNCNDQEEVDYYWEKLSAIPESEQCGWLKDKYGVSWQIIPKQLGELMSNPDPDKAQKATQAMLKMKKINIQELENATNS